MNPEKKRSVSIEDLLRLKRLERPATEFWPEFDRQLRAKQLSALVGKRPWWQDISLSGVLTGFRRYQVPLGAAAIVALTFVSMRMTEHKVSSVLEHSITENSVQVPVKSVALPLDRIQGVASVAVPEKSGNLIVAAAVVATGPALELATEEATADGFSHFIPLLGVPDGDAFNASVATPVNYGKSAYASGAAMEPVVVNSLLGNASRFESHGMVTRATVEPLQQITSPNERRGHRILTAMVSMASVESAMRTTERAASRLSEEQLYDQIHRFGARGAGVNVKF